MDLAIKTFILELFLTLFELIVLNCFFKLFDLFHKKFFFLFGIPHFLLVLIVFSKNSPILLDLFLSLRQLLLQFDVQFEKILVVLELCDLLGPHLQSLAFLLLLFEKIFQFLDLSLELFCGVTFSKRERLVERYLDNFILIFLLLDYRTEV